VQNVTRVLSNSSKEREAEKKQRVWALRNRNGLVDSPFTAEFGNAIFSVACFILFSAPRTGLLTDNLSLLSVYQKLPFNLPSITLEIANDNSRPM
jgi:hypothetical protein